MHICGTGCELNSVYHQQSSKYTNLITVSVKQALQSQKVLCYHQRRFSFQYREIVTMTTLLNDLVETNNMIIFDIHYKLYHRNSSLFSFHPHSVEPRVSGPRYPENSPHGRISVTICILAYTKIRACELEAAFWGVKWPIHLQNGSQTQDFWSDDILIFVLLFTRL